MELTTGAILRRITETPLSTAAHKLATIILDGIAWKDGYNGLERGTAAFTLAHLAEKMGVSRQHLTALLVELAASGLALVRWKPNGKFAPWLFRFGGTEMPMRFQMSCQLQATHHYLEILRTKLSLQGGSRLAQGTNVYRHAMGRPDQGREGVARLLERRYAGHLGAFPCVQPVREAMRRVPAGYLARLHAALADQFVEARLHRLQQRRCRSIRLTRKRKSFMIRSGLHQAPTGSFTHRICAG